MSGRDRRSHHYEQRHRRRSSSRDSRHYRRSSSGDDRDWRRRSRSPIPRRHSRSPSPRRRRHRSPSYSADEHRRSPSPRRRSRSRNKLESPSPERLPQPRDKSPRRRSPSPDPTSSLMIRNLKIETDEDDISKVIKVSATVRIMRERETGVSRGFGYIDFASIKECQAFYESVVKSGIVIEGSTCTVRYTRGAQGHAEQTDWLCARCNALNFSRRTACYSCGAPLDDHCMPILPNTEGPRTTLIAHGLAPNVTDEEVTSLFESFSTIKRVRVIRDRNTGVSKGFCFVEFFREEDARITLKHCVKNRVALNGTPLTVDVARRQPGIDDDDTGYTGPDPDLESALKAGEYVLDPSSGLQYSIKTGYYYDRSKNLFYDTVKERYMFWDTSLGMYVPHGAAEQLGSTNPVRERVVQPKKADTIQMAAPTALATDADEAKVSLNFKSKVSRTVIQRWNQRSKEVRREETKPVMIDWNTYGCDMDTLCCLLCRRKFKAATTLQRHMTESELHASNVVKEKERIEYKDRAAMRRDMHGQSVNQPLIDARMEKRVMNDEPIGSDNVGAMLMRKMGWKDGEGLGVDGDGITEAVKVEVREVGVGLGAQSGTDVLTAHAGDSDKIIQRKRVMKGLM